MKKNKEETGPVENLESFVGSAKEYIDMQIDSLKLRMVENLSLLFSRIIYTLLLIILLGIAVAFMASALSWYIGALLDSRVWGSLITAGVFILFAIIIIFKRKKLLIDSMVKMFIPMFFESSNISDQEGKA